MLRAVGAIDCDDDGVKRFVVRRYAFDPVRRERRHIVVAVVDNNREFERLIQRLSAELQTRRASGEAVDSREQFSGNVMEPGHLARAAKGRLVRRAIKHGVMPEQLLSVELPGNIAVFRTAPEQ